MTRKTLALYVGRLVSSGSTLLLLAIVARRLGADALGVVGIGMAVGSVLSALTDLGCTSLVVRAMAQRPDRERQTVGALAVIRLVTVPLGLALAYPVLSVVFPGHATAVWLAASWLAVQQFTEVGRSVLVYGRRAGLAGLHTSLENLAWVCSIGALIVLGAPLETAFAAGLLVLALSAASGFLLNRWVLGWFPGMPAADDFRRLLRELPPFAAFVVLGQTYSRIDTVLVGWLLPGGVSAAGAYFAAMRIIGALEYLPDALTRAIYPELARAYVARRGQLRQLMARPAAVLLWISIPIPFAALLAGQWAYALLLGPGVASYGWILLAVSVFVPIRFVGYLLGVVLTSGGSQARRAAAVGLAAVLVIGLDVVLLPRLGLVAAVIAVAVAWSSTFLIYLWQTWREFGLPRVGVEAVEWLGIAIVGSAAGAVVRAALPDAVAPPIALAALAIVYMVGSMVRRPPALRGELGEVSAAS